MTQKFENEDSIQLKEQMDILKKQLQKDLQIDDNQIIKTVRSYGTNYSGTKSFLGGVGAASLFIYWILWLLKNWLNVKMPIIALIPLVIIAAIVGYLLRGKFGGKTKYEVENGKLLIKPFGKKVRKQIDIATIRHIEILNSEPNFWRGAILSIGYNLCDDINIDPQDHIQLIGDIVRINPNIKVYPKK